VNLIGVDDISKEDADEIFEIVDDIKNGKTTASIKEGAVLAFLCAGVPTETKIALEVASSKLGGKCVDIDCSTCFQQNNQLQPSFENTIYMLNLYADFICTYLPSQDAVAKVAEISTVPVINIASELEAPLQALTDLYTMREAKKGLKGLQLAILGGESKGITNSLILLGAKLGVKIAIAIPEINKPSPIYFVKAREHGIVEEFNEPEDAVADADIIYALPPGAKDHIPDALAKYLLSNELLSKAQAGALVMQPLVSESGGSTPLEILESKKSLVWQQVKNKLAVAEALILFVSEKSL